MFELLFLAAVVGGGVWFWRSRQQDRQLGAGKQPEAEAEVASPTTEAAAPTFDEEGD